MEKSFGEYVGTPYKGLMYSCDNQESIVTAHLNNFFSLFQVYYYRPLLLNYKNPVVRIHALGVGLAQMLGRWTCNKAKDEALLACPGQVKLEVG